MTAPSRRDVFANLLANYHNSFTGRVGDVVEHSPLFIRQVVEATADPALAAATLKLDPRLTSTDTGAVAFAIAKAISEDKQLAPNFLDIELIEGTLMVYFEAKVPADKAEKKLAEAGRVGIVAKPGDLIADGVKSDLYILAVTPAEKVSESVIAEMKKKFPAFLKKGDKDKKDCDDKKKDEAAPAPVVPADGTYRPADEAKHYGLDEAVFGDEALAHCVADAGAVRAVFSGLYGEKALGVALAAQIGESCAPAADDAAGQRNRLLRILAGRGAIAPDSAAAWPALVAEAIGKAVGAAGDKWTLVEGKGRAANEAAVYEAMRDEVAIAIDAVTEDIGEVFEAFVDRVADLGLVASSDEKRAALIGRVTEAANKDAAIVPRCLSALARVAMFERGFYADAAQRDAVAAWDAYVVEATKPAPVPATSADTILNDLLGLGA